MRRGWSLPASAEFMGAALGPRCYDRRRLPQHTRFTGNKRAAGWHALFCRVRRPAREGQLIFW
jgi:hypothetical protein